MREVVDGQDARQICHVETAIADMNQDLVGLLAAAITQTDAGRSEDPEELLVERAEPRRADLGGVEPGQHEQDRDGAEAWSTIGADCRR